MKTGSIPAVGEVATGKLCTNWNLDCCNPTRSFDGIQLKNCGTYYVYRLKPVICNSMYCVTEGMFIIMTAYSPYIHVTISCTFGK